MEAKLTWTGKREVWCRGSDNTVLYSHILTFPLPTGNGKTVCGPSLMAIFSFPGSTGSYQCSIFPGLLALRYWDHARGTCWRSFFKFGTITGTTHTTNLVPCPNLISPFNSPQAHYIIARHPQPWASSILGQGSPPSGKVANAELSPSHERHTPELS